ncbi:MAG: DUF4153 domain-containing protein [Prevotellaceae bacterium]|nr:DUF4153 domain-containing protein [Prevotellaceae bacterium]
MDNPISFQRVKAQALIVFHEFLLPCIFAVLLAAISIYMIITEKSNGAIIYYLTAAYLLSLMLKLWTDETRNKRLAVVVSLVAHAVLLIDATVLFQKDSSDFEVSTFIARGAVCLALVLGICFLPFVREKDDIPSWNFVLSLVKSVAMSFIVGGIMSIGVMLLIMGIKTIFAVNIDEKCYFVTFVVFLQLLPMLLFLSRIPMGEKRHDYQPMVSGFLNGTTRYLFIPLVCCYMLVLYAHLAYILVTWELPDGAVSMLVSVMMSGIIAIEFLLYPTMQSGAAKRFETFIVKWMPIAALPLVILMTVGIFRRFEDYGVTANRLYMITLNIWFYAVCIGLFLTHTRRIHWVSLSFCALLLLTSAHPFNYYELVRHSMTAKIESVFEQYAPTALPLRGNNEVENWLKTLPKDMRAKTYSQLVYLQRYYNRKNLGKWLVDSYLYGSYTEDVGDYELLFSIDEYDDIVSVPDGFGRVCHTYINKTVPIKKAMIGDSITMSVTFKHDSITADFVLSRKALKAQRTSGEEVIFVDKTGNYALCPENFHIENNSDDLHFYGDYYIFIKR